MKPPNWLAEVMAEQGDLVLRGKKTRAEADQAVAAATLGHPEFGEGLGIASALGMFGKWVRGHASSGDLFQAQMFPGLPVTLLIAPKTEKPVADMTGEELDHARNMLHARTSNAIRGARASAMAERETFDGFYGQVRPHLKDGLRVSDVMGKVALAAAPERDDAAAAKWLKAALAQMEPAEVMAEMRQRHPEYADALLMNVITGLHDGMSPEEAIRAAAEKAA